MGARALMLLPPISFLCESSQNMSLPPKKIISCPQLPFLQKWLWAPKKRHENGLPQKQNPLLLFVVEISLASQLYHVDVV